jgi:hypothetical protein
MGADDCRGKGRTFDAAFFMPEWNTMEDPP